VLTKYAALQREMAQCTEERHALTAELAATKEALGEAQRNVDRLRAGGDGLLRRLEPTEFGDNGHAECLYWRSIVDEPVMHSDHNVCAHCEDVLLPDDPPRCESCKDGGHHASLADCKADGPCWAASDLGPTERPNPDREKCAVCRRQRGKHKAGTLQCPVGRGSHPSFADTTFTASGGSHDR
jgi:hypothetical protein